MNKKDFSIVLETLTKEQRKAMDEYVALVKKIEREQVLAETLSAANRIEDSFDGLGVRLMIYDRWNAAKDQIGW